MAELGLEAALASGAGADQLVPCDRAGLVLVADTLRAHAALLDRGGWSLSRVEVTGWRGAANDGFAAAIEPEPVRWRTAAESFLAGAAALEGFVAAVGLAREVAARATESYRAYERAVAAMASTAVRPAVVVGARIETLQQAQSSGEVDAVAAAEALRRQAIALLDSARSAVAAAGDLAAQGLARAAAGAPEARRFWESTIRPADAVGAGHTTLDLAGYLPGAGAAPDGVNAAWYALGGDWEQAAWSGIAAVPVVGDWLAAGRKAVKAANVVGSTERAAPRGPASGPGWLATHEIDGSHTLEKHVGASRTYLVSRLYGADKVSVASSFLDETQAEEVVAEALKRRSPRIEGFISNPDKRRTSFRIDMNAVTGYGVSAVDDSLISLRGVEVFLVKDPTADGGYRVWTAFPTRVR